MAEQRIGRYSVLEPIGSGGCATVHLAQMVGPLGFSRTLAVKRLHPQLAAESELAIMLLDEARVSSRIRSPFVVPTLDVVAEDRELLIVMEYVVGASVAELARGGSVAPEIACAMLVDVLHGLHAAHELADDAGASLGIVHRDVSPQNVLVGADGISRLLDFGIAKAMGRIQTTREGLVKGKAAYMSPEQVRGEKVDRRTDVFAAGVVLWELLTGRRLFASDGVVATIANVLAAAIPAPSTFASGVSAALDDVVLRALAPERAHRYDTAMAFAEALEHTIRPAPRARVAEWVDGKMHDEIVRKRRRVAELDARAAPPGAMEGASPAPAPFEATASAVDVAAEETTPPKRHAKRPSKRILTVVALAAVALGIGGAALARFALRGASPSEPIAAPASSSPPPVAVEAPPVEPSSPSPPAPLEIPSASTTSEHVPARTRSGTRKATVDCRDPYVLDAEGRRRYRRECLTR